VHVASALTWMGDTGVVDPDVDASECGNRRIPQTLQTAFDVRPLTTTLWPRFRISAARPLPMPRVLPVTTTLSLALMNHPLELAS